MAVEDRPVLPNPGNRPALPVVGKGQRRGGRKSERKSPSRTSVPPLLPVFHLWSSLSSKCHQATSQRTFLLSVLGQEYEQVGCPRLPLFYSSDPPVLKTKTKPVISTVHSFTSVCQFFPSGLTDFECLVLHWSRNAHHLQCIT